MMDESEEYPPSTLSMKDRLPSTVAADCGCSLTICHNSVIDYPNPKAHFQDSLLRAVQDFSMDDNVRSSFCRVLDLKVHSSINGRTLLNFLPDHWADKFRRVIDGEPYPMDEKSQIYRLLSLQEPSEAECNAWALESTANADLSRHHEAEAYSYGSSSQYGTPNSLWQSDISQRNYLGEIPQGQISLRNSEGLPSTSYFSGGYSENQAAQQERRVRFIDYSES